MSFHPILISKPERTSARPLLSATLCAIVAVLALAAPASAATVTNQRPLLFSFDGHDSTAGRFTQPEGLATDSSGNVYVLNTAGEDEGPGPFDSRRVVDKFNSEGIAENFAATGKSSLDGSATPGGAFGVLGAFGTGSILTDVAVDNSAVNPARLYVSESNGPIHAFAPDGSYLWTLPRVDDNGTPANPNDDIPVTEGSCGIAVDGAGHLWVGVGFGERKEALEFASSGSPPAQIGSVSLSAGNGRPCTPAVDQTGNDLYVADYASVSHPSTNKYVGGVFDSTVSTVPVRDIAIDQSSPSGHLFAINNTGFGEFDSSGAPVPGSPFGGGSIGIDLHGDSQAEEETCAHRFQYFCSGRGIAYNPAKDWVYVTDLYTNTVKVFGPAASGPAPDVTSGKTDGITKTEATAHGTINPQGLANSYHFEWIKGEGQRVRVQAGGGSFALTMVAAKGSGATTNGSNFITEVKTSFGAFRVGDLIGAGSPFPPGTTITAVDAETLTLSANAFGGGLARLVASEATEPIAWNAPAGKAEGSGSVEAALEALLPIGASNVAVSGTPADASGTPGEYTVAFKNALSGQNVDQIGSDSAGLAGGSHQASVATVTQGQSWAAAEPISGWPEANPSIEPTDSAVHPVSTQLTGLRPNTTYDVRLAGTNTEAEGDPDKHLNSYSSPPDTFTTLPPPAASVTGLTVSAVDADSAHLAATVDPKEDQTSWQILTSTGASAGADQAECEALSALAFKVAKQGTIPLGEAGTVAIDEDLTGLERGQTYCVRFTATNGGGSGQEDRAFTTEAVKPSEAKLAFAAPRTDTGARLNAYVNPEGESPLTYRFEYSADGANWTALPELISTVEAHGQIVVGEQLSGLIPQTTYHYRLGLVKNDAGEIPVASLGEAKSFTTRSSAEMTLPSNALGEAEKRGVELVNSPDTGNQNARAAGLYSQMSSLRADGEEFLWTVFGGAPGSNSGTQATFRAKRTSAGWVSQSILPPAAEQVGGGGLAYSPAAATSDFASFLFTPALPSVLTTGPPTFVRLDPSGNQQVLHSYQQAILFNFETTADLAHVLAVDPDTHKLEDIGSGSPEQIGLIPPSTAPIGAPRPGGSQPLCGLDAGAGSFTGPGNGGAGDQFEDGYHRMSTSDASRVYFQVHPDATSPSCNGPWALYERNREADPPTTTAIVPPNLATNDTAIIRATPDGRSAYFVTSAKIEAADKNTTPDVYRWDEPTGKATAGKSTCVTCGLKNEKGEKVGDANISLNDSESAVSPVLVSDDFSHIYFTSTDRLIAGLGVQGERNVYASSSGVIRFVATAGRLGDFTQLSSDGDVLTLLSDKALTADRLAAECSVPSAPTSFGLPCRELYRYDDRDGSVECLSCRHDATTTHSVGISTALGKAFQVSADGGTFAFTTAEALVPLDVNNSADLYEWRDGTVRLITDGLTRYPVGLASPIPQAVGADGSNIVFSVASPGLTGFEKNGLANLYDARIGGGFPPPNPPEHCSGESCQGPLQAPPPTPGTGSAAFKGHGNEGTPAKPRCRKGKVRRHGRCASRHAHKHRKRAGHANRGRTK